MDRAIRLEEARTDEHAEAGAHSHAEAGAAAVQHHEELFTRGTQHFGLVVTSLVLGLALGVLCAIAYALIHRRSPDAAPWPRALLLAGGAFLAVSLLPALRYPANPPGVGDSGTVTDRQGLWLAAVTIGVLGMLLVWQVYVRLAHRSLPVRQVAAAGTAIAILAVLFALPGNPDEVPVSATLLWDFRVLSLASHALLWAVFGVVFGALGLRALGRHAPATAPSGAVAAS